MPVESAFDYIDDLVDTNPNVDDDVSEGQQHLTGIKKALQGNVRGDGVYTALRVGADDVLIAESDNTTLVNPANSTVSLRLQVEAVPQMTLQADPAGAVSLRALRVSAGFDVQLTGAGGLQTALSAAADGAVQGNYAGVVNFEGGIGGLSIRRQAGQPGTRLELKSDAGVVDGELVTGTTSMVLRGKLLNGVVGLYANRAGADELQANFSPVDGPHLYRSAKSALSFSAVGPNAYGSTDTLDIGLYNNDGGTLLGSIISSPSYMGLLNRREGVPFRVFCKIAGVDRTMIYAEHTAGIQLYVGSDSLVKLQVNNAAISNSRAQLADATGTLRPIGYNVMPRLDVTGSSTLTQNDCGSMKLSTGVANVTVPASVFGAGEVVTFAALSGAITLTQGAGFTLYWMNGSGTLVSGNRTVALTGMASIWFSNSTSGILWGTGIS